MSRILTRFSSLGVLAFLANDSATGAVAEAPATEGAAPAADAAPAEVKPFVDKEFSFFFKKDKLGNKRPTIKLNIPVPTIVGLATALENEKVQELVLSLIEDEIIRNARVQVNDEQKPVNTQEELDLTKLAIEYIANLPKAERTGGGISKEVWELFAEDYIAVMPGATGKTADQVGNAAKLLTSKFQPVKTNKPVIKVLKEYLALYAATTQNLEEFADCVEFLDKKADALLAADEAALLANL